MGVSDGVTAGSPEVCARSWRGMALKTMHEGRPACRNIRASVTYLCRDVTGAGAKQFGGHLIAALHCVKGACKKERGLLKGLLKSSEGTQGRSFKLESRFGLDVGKKFLSLRAVRPWHGLPRKAVDAPSLEVLRSLDGAGLLGRGFVTRPLRSFQLKLFRCSVIRAMILQLFIFLCRECGFWARSHLF